MQYFALAYQRMFDFNGRSTRKEFWVFFLLYTLVVFSLFIAEEVFGRTEINLLYVMGIYGVVSIMPNLAIQVRRLHDTGRPASWLLLSLIPFGGLVLLFFFAQPSDPDRNQWGAPEKSL